MYDTLIPFALSCLQWAAGPIGFIGWRAYTAMSEKAEDTAQALFAFKLHCAENYATKGELSEAIRAFNRSIDAVFAKLERIEDKLDNKQDKV